MIEIIANSCSLDSCSLDKSNVKFPKMLKLSGDSVIL